MAKTINTILALKDKFSNGIKKAANNTNKLDKKTKMASNTVKKFGRDMNKMAISAAKNTAKVAGAMGSLATGVGFNEAFNLEGYRLQLETATKDTKKAADIMKYSMTLANKNPFEGGQLVEGAAQFEAMGMSAKKWLPLAGDMAAATNKDFGQATEALIDAQNGELERLKEFGIKKESIVKYAYEKMGKVQVVNNQGQITNQEKFNEALVALMEDKFKGGMEKQASTVKGLWSTVTGVTKSSLATIVGITSEGTVKQGSALDLLKGKIQGIADKLVMWQQDGTIEEVSRKASVAFNGLSSAIKFCMDNMGWILPVASGLIGTFAAFNIITTVVGMMKTLGVTIKGITAATSVMNFVMSLNPIALIAIAIGVAIAAGVALWKNWDTIKAKAQELWEKVNKLISKIKDFFNLPSKKEVSLNTRENRTVNIDERRTSGTGRDKSDYNPRNKPKNPRGNTAPRHALGTKYFAGGVTQINEGGRGEMAVLPSGSKILPADKTKQALGSSKNEVNVNVTIQGNVIGNETFADEVGNKVATKILLALDNM